MTIKPVLVPDHDAVSLRKLMDHFAEAATGPTRRQLAESRSAVTAARKTFAESSRDVDHMPGATRNDLAKDMQAGCKRCGGHSHVYKDETGKVSQNNFPGAKKYKCGACSKPGVTEGEGMSRAAKGYEKYGRAGMQALAKAGREGRALDPVRQRYDRYDEAVAEGSAGAELKAIDGDYYEDSTDFFSMFEQDHFDREEESEDGMEIRGYIDDVCVMVFKFSTPDMMGGWGNYDDSALMAESGVEDDDHDYANRLDDEQMDENVPVHKPVEPNRWAMDTPPDDDEEGETCPECDGAGCPECYGDEHRDRAHDHAQGTQRESADGAAGVKYGVFAKGGSVGSQRFRDDPLKTFDTKEEATADARRRRSGLSKGERGYYRMGYVVKPIKGEVAEDDVDDFVAGGGKITQVKPNPGPRRSGASLGSKHIGTVRGGKASSISGKRANTHSTVKPVVAVEQQVDEKSEAVRRGNNNPSIYHVDESVDPIEQLRADIRRFAQ